MRGFGDAAPVKFEQYSKYDKLIIGLGVLLAFMYFSNRGK